MRSPGADDRCPNRSSLAFDSATVQRCSRNEAFITRHRFTASQYVSVGRRRSRSLASLSLDVRVVVEVGEEEEVRERENDEAVAEELRVVRTLEHERADGVRDDENKLRLQRQTASNNHECSSL